MSSLVRMGGRRALVIGSQCQSYNLLSFLPAAAREMADALLDPVAGGCEPALPDGALLIDPTAVALDDAVSEAFAQASAAEATLFLALVGHGDYVGDDFYLLANDTGHPPTSRESFLLAQRIKELLTRHSLVDGLVLLLDTCHAGIAATQAARRWVDIVGQAGRRFEVLTASDDRTAADGCFTRTLAATLRAGSTQLGRYVRCADLKPILTRTCQRQTAQYLAFDGQRSVTAGDQGLWLGHNAAGPWHTWPFAGTAVADDIERLARYWRPNAQLGKVVAAVLGGARTVAMIDGAAALAALAHPTVADEHVPARFMHGVVLAAFNATAGEVASQLADQLSATVPGFAEAADDLQGQLGKQASADLDEFDYHVTLPLRTIALSDSRWRTVRIGINLDGAAPAILSAIYRAVAGFPDCVQVVLATRTPVDLPPDTAVVVRARPGDTPPWVRQTRGTPSPWQSTIHGIVGPPGLLGVLDEISLGMKLPIRLLTAASARFGGPAHESHVRDVLTRLDRVIRDDAGTDQERIGPTRWRPRGLPVANGALADAIAEVAPMAEHDRTKPEHAYAERAEAEHLWFAKRYDETIRSLDARASPVPVENRNRWARWHARATESLGPTHRFTLVSAARQATWTAKAGDPTTALTRFTELRPVFERELGPTDPDTLSVRHNLAYWSTETGDAGWAAEEFEAIAATLTELVGAEHADTLDTRLQAAIARAKNNEHLLAVERLTTLLPVCDRALGPSHKVTNGVVDNLLFWGAESGHPPPDTLALIRRLVEAGRAMTDDLDGITRRYHAAMYLAKSDVDGSAAEARAEFRALLPISTSVLGEHHPQTRRIIDQLAFWS